MQTNLLSRIAVVEGENTKGEIVAVEMKQDKNCFLVITILTPDGKLRTFPERQISVESD